MGGHGGVRGLHVHGAKETGPEAALPLNQAMEEMTAEESKQKRNCARKIVSQVDRLSCR